MIPAERGSMKRDLQKCITNYKKHRKEAFYWSDITQIVDMSTGRDADDYIFDLTNNALMVGFEIGYRKAERETRQHGQARQMNH